MYTSVSIYPIYGISSPFAALSLSQLRPDCTSNVGFKNWLKNDSVIVVTIDPVSKINGTIMSPIFKSITGLSPISFCTSGEPFLSLPTSRLSAVGLIRLNPEC